MTKIGTIVDDNGTQLDVIEPDYVDIVIRQDGQVVWISIDGVTRLRACRIKGLGLTDLRPKPEAGCGRCWFCLKKCSCTNCGHCTGPGGPCETPRAEP